MWLPSFLMTTARAHNNRRLPTVDWRLPIVDCQLLIADWVEIRASLLESGILNLESPGGSADPRFWGPRLFSP